MNHSRILYWDVAKAVAIFLVVWGHILQNLTLNSDYWLTDVLSQFIVSFHMPLFMLVSGYFAYSSLKKEFWSVLFGKFRQLIVPSVLWYIIVAGMAMVWHAAFTLQRLSDISSALFSSYWFLKSLFMCYLILLIGNLLYRINHSLIGVYGLLIWFLAEQLNYVSTISMLPFFLAGFALRLFGLLDKLNIYIMGGGNGVLSGVIPII